MPTSNAAAVIIGISLAAAAAAAAAMAILAAAAWCRCFRRRNVLQELRKGWRRRRRTDGDGHGGAGLPAAGSRDLESAFSPAASASASASAAASAAVAGDKKIGKEVAQVFTYKQLQAATAHFSPAHLIGDGGSSRVYRASLPDGRDVAVKRILMMTVETVREKETPSTTKTKTKTKTQKQQQMKKKQNNNNNNNNKARKKSRKEEEEEEEDDYQLEEEEKEEEEEEEKEDGGEEDEFKDDHDFRGEVDLLSRLHSPYLLKLVGYCADQEHRLLVYEHMPNGSLQEHLYSDGSAGNPPVLDWASRLRIAFDAARGLEYLHELNNPPVIHRDFKTSNILLDAHFNAKVSDFGLARIGSNKVDGEVSTRILGTHGYVAPEYALTGHLTIKSDVYSFGVVLLELLTGRVPVDMKRPPGEGVLVSWALPRLSDKAAVETLVDPALKGQYSAKELVQVAAIAKMCVQSNPDYRPIMTDVVQTLAPLVNRLGK